MTPALDEARQIEGESLEGRSTSFGNRLIVDEECAVSDRTWVSIGEIDQDCQQLLGRRQLLQRDRGILPFSNDPRRRLDKAHFGREDLYLITGFKGD